MNTRALQTALAGATLVGASALSLAAPATAHADTTTPAGCVAAKQVWVVVLDENGAKLADKCVGTPATGTKALEAAGITVARDSKKMICSLSGHPAVCPTKFNGQYWNYNTLLPGGAWTFSKVGADSSRPTPGSVEGWCFNKKNTMSCTPPPMNLEAAAVPAKGNTASPVLPPSPTAAPTRMTAAPVPKPSTMPSGTGIITPSASGVTFTPDPTGDATGSPVAVPVPSTPASGVASPSADQASAVPASPAAESTESKDSTPWGVIGTLAALVVAALGYLVWRRRGKPTA